MKEYHHNQIEKQFQIIKNERNNLKMEKSS